MFSSTPLRIASCTRAKTSMTGVKSSMTGLASQHHRFSTRSAQCTKHILRPSSLVVSRFYSTMHDNDPDVLEIEKQRNLSKTQHKTSTPHPEAPGWNEHLASAAEAAVKADKATGKTTIEMQKVTVNYIQARHTPDDQAAHHTSEEADQVLGPLSSHSEQKTETTRDEVLGPLKDKGEKQALEEDSTGSEEAVKADRGEI